MTTVAVLPNFRSRVTARRRAARGIIVDNFAGAGGASLGIEAALGRCVDVAINHDAHAVRVHEANHPGTRHYQSDVWEVDPVEACGGRPVDLAWYSPDCKHFSKAKGGRPVSKRVRGLAWVVVRWVKALRPTAQHPKVIVIENVEEFQTWGPLVGDRPCPVRKGDTFRRWVAMLREYGYEVAWRELRACDYGAPTKRKRLFLIARCDGRPIRWPKATHADPKHAAQLGLKPWRTAAECIDWSLPIRSIFDRKPPLAEKTLRRIAGGLRRYVFEAKELGPFIATLSYGRKHEFRGHKLDEPLRTLPTSNTHAVCVPYVLTNTSGHPGARVEAPLAIITTGNHHALVAAFIIKHYGGVYGHHPDKTLGAITARDSHGIVTASLGVGDRTAEVRAFLTAFYGADRDGQSLRNPMRTITVKQRFGVVVVEGIDYQIRDIGLRMLAPRELLRAQFGRFSDEYILVGTIEQQIAGIGNSVCPELAEAVVRANVGVRVRGRVA